MPSVVAPRGTNLAAEAAAKVIIASVVRDSPITRLYATGRLSSAEMRAILAHAVDQVAALMSTRAAR
jgi:hypothetical protein